MSRCRRCNRFLKTEPWASIGIGKICSKKERVDTQKQENGDSDIIVPYDGGDIWIERLGSMTLANSGNDLNVSVHPASGIKTNVQRSIYKHSPTGFNFGYGGSGPADFALNILRMFCKDEKFIDRIYQDFKFKFVARGEDRLVIPRQEILNYLEEKKKAAVI